MFKTLLLLVSMLISSLSWSTAIIDPDLRARIHNINKSTKDQTPQKIPALVFLQNKKDIASFMKSIKGLPGVSAQYFDSFPVVLVLLPKEEHILDSISFIPTLMQISSLQAGQEELEFSEQAILLRPSSMYPSISNWWDAAYTGQQSIIGLLDSGVAVEHPSLSQKQIIIRKETGSGYQEFKNGLRSAHGTGVACIYAGSGNTSFPNDIGIAISAPTIISGLAGEGAGSIDDIGQTLNSLDWMLQRAGTRPHIINYSFGNGPSNCKDCPDWSGLAKVVDYVVNQYQVLWVKSAGNNGYLEPAQKAPYPSTMTSPADNYNGITVANMNPTLMDAGFLSLNPDRAEHRIQYSSSRGPTINGRKKPDISAPGHNSRTCAPDPNVYSFSYSKSMDYHDGYRLMGGTSAAAPHVGAAAALLDSAGIHSPMAQKALLINSADAYTDSNQAGPNDPKYHYQGGHYPVMGSEWNRSYGWGYLNMQKAYEERNNLIHDKLTLQNPEKIYEVDLPVAAKITLVHERRVGYNQTGEWKLSHLSLEIIDLDRYQTIMLDDSAKDTVHQVANCKRKDHEPFCSNSSPVHALVRVRLLSTSIDGAEEEPFALASTVMLPIKH